MYKAKIHTAQLKELILTDDEHRPDRRLLWQLSAGDDRFCVHCNGAQRPVVHTQLLKMFCIQISEACEDYARQFVTR